MKGGLRQVRGVLGQAQIRREGHQETGVRREGLRRHDDVGGGGGQGPTAAEVFQSDRRLRRGERGPNRE